jgi:hypothetical protein
MEAIFTQCPGHSVVEPEAGWLAAPELAYFTICHPCFKEHMVGTSMEGCFVEEFIAGQRCEAHRRHVLQHVLDMAASGCNIPNDIEAMYEFRADLGNNPPCVVGMKHIRYHTMYSDDGKPVLNICSDCFAGYFRATGYGESFRFAPDDPEGTRPAQEIHCDMTIPFVSRAYATQPQLETFSTL